VLAEANQELTADDARQASSRPASARFEVFFPERDEVGMVVSATLKKDPVKTQNDALIEIYRKLRPGDPPTLDTATQLFQGMFFDPRKYDFSRVGRMKFNIKLYDNAETPRRSTSARSTRTTSSPRSATCCKLRKGVGAVDDIDHLGNRRVRAVGELLENQFRIGLVRMERAIKEKMSVYQEMSTAMPHDLVNAKPVMAAIREFFGSSQLSQFMDQTNPLSEITHKRRLSALGPGGLSRERAGFEVRDVHAHALRPHLPHRDAGRPEHRPDQLAELLCAHQRVRLHREPYRRVENGVVQSTSACAEPGRHEPARWATCCARGEAEKAQPRGREARSAGRVRGALRVPVGVGRRQVRHRPGQHGAGREGRIVRSS
jgi:DNA-directed RNA polymerase subunit beta